MSQFKLDYTGAEVNNLLGNVAAGVGTKLYHHRLQDSNGISVHLIIPSRDTPLTAAGTDFLGAINRAYFPASVNGINSYCGFAFQGTVILKLYKFDGTSVNFNSGNYTDEVTAL